MCERAKLTWGENNAKRKKRRRKITITIVYFLTFNSLVHNLYITVQICTVTKVLDVQKMNIYMSIHIKKKKNCRDQSMVRCKEIIVLYIVLDAISMVFKSTSNDFMCDSLMNKERCDT